MPPVAFRPRRWSLSPSAGRRAERGTAAVTTISAGVVLLGVMLVVQFALAYYARQVLSGAAQDGAVAAARLDTSPETGRLLAEDLVDQAGSSLLLSRKASVVEDGDHVVVVVQGEVVSLLPFRRSFDVEASGSAPLERFRPQQAGS